ncbi:IS3 family transposase [Amycolatopsis suaedae]|uniref:IS3 family transposase n=1 Tax=Amycolatopsis suaedae TaxID=2510978 RepID=UPI003B82D5AC
MELETGVKILRKAAAAVEKVVPPKARFVLVAELAAEGVPVKQACLSLGVSRAGFYEARSHPPSARATRQAWLTDQITAIHEASRQTYGAPRVRAELVLGHGVSVSRKTVAALTRRAGLAGLPLRRKAKRVPSAKTITDLVKRDFHRDGRNQLWATDITEHLTREGKLYCCVVLDAYSRRGVGWAIDSRQRADLATSALGMAIDSRGIAGQIPGGIIHGDHGTQFTSWTFTECARTAGLLPFVRNAGSSGAGNIDGCCRRTVRSTRSARPGSVTATIGRLMPHLPVHDHGGGRRATQRSGCDRSRHDATVRHGPVTVWCGRSPMNVCPRGDLNPHALYGH